jgi:hypothetical protein
MGMPVQSLRTIEMSILSGSRSKFGIHYDRVQTLTIASLPIQAGKLIIKIAQVSGARSVIAVLYLHLQPNKQLQREDILAQTQAVRKYTVFMRVITIMIYHVTNMLLKGLRSLRLSTSWKLI